MKDVSWCLRSIYLKVSIIFVKGLILISSKTDHIIIV
jgi:hypothetical protein